MKAEIKVLKGRVTMNGQTYNQLNNNDKKFMDKLLRIIKINKS